MVLRDVPSDCTVVGVPGRVVYRSGVRVNPLEHGLLPDSEANVIRTLVDRIEALEEQLETLQQQPTMAAATHPASQHLDSQKHSLHNDSCRLSDREIQEFLGGAGE